MDSKVLISLNWHKEVVISIDCPVRKGDIRLLADIDVRDRMVEMFTNDASPGGSVNDGYAQVRKMYDEGGHRYYEIVPIHPIDMPKHINFIIHNANQFKNGDGDEIKLKEISPSHQEVAEWASNYVDVLCPMHEKPNNIYDCDTNARMEDRKKIIKTAIDAMFEKFIK